jgi:hypothetical protein
VILPSLPDTKNSIYKNHYHKIDQERPIIEEISIEKRCQARPTDGNQ